MPADNFNMDELTIERRKAIEETIHPISIDELRALGESLFPHSDHPWRETYFSFMSENAGATFEHAITHDGVNIIYCRERDKGMWFTPGGGMGPLQAKGLGILKQIQTK
jgi:hypothetical protein